MEPADPQHIPIARRSIMLAGLAFLAGCATTGTSVTKLPDLAWPDAAPGGATGTTRPAPQPKTTAPATASVDGVLPRSAWARGTPDAAAMNPMLPVEYITVHHDGMTPFTATDYASSAARIELYRNGHRGRGWGDIGYHFVIDREGRIWEGRSLKWQGAHVRNRNEGNLGILVMGNFDEQAPSDRQLAALERHLRTCMSKYKVPVARVRTHREWDGAKTACPGKNLQSKMATMRSKSLRA
jgi:hypothetical protein